MNSSDISEETLPVRAAQADLLPPTDAVIAKIMAHFDQSSFTKKEQFVILITVNAVQDFQRCCELLSRMALYAGLTSDQVIRLNYQGLMPSRRMNALREITTLCIERQGHVYLQDAELFLAVGFETEQLNELIKVVMQISHYGKEIEI